MGFFKRKSTKALSVSVPSKDQAASKSSSAPTSATASATNGSSGAKALKSPSLLGRTMKSPNSPAFANLPKIDLPKPPDPNADPAAYLRSIYAVRERCGVVMEKARQNTLKHFDVDMSKLDETVKWVTGIIKRDYAPDYHTIPPHGRWQHFDVGGRPRVEQLLQGWPASQVDSQESCRRLLDLFVVSVLLDAGAGTKWQYKSVENSKCYRRSEGLAVASLEMFKAGLFSSNPKQPCQVDSKGLKALTVEAVAKGLQVTDENPIEGLDGRTGLLVRLGDALQNQEIFGEMERPGHILDHILSHPTTQAASVPIVLLPTLWNTLMDGLVPIWPPSRTKVNDVSIGDAWPCSVMPSHPSHPWENIVPFHKLTQWLCYSLMVPMTKLLNVHFVGVELMTGLPEYRNGGLLIDTGLLTLKPADTTRGVAQFHENARNNGGPKVEVVPVFSPDDDVIVEWRAVTVGFLDEIHNRVNEELKLTGPEKLSLAQVLEAGTWKGGREIAEVSRPNTKAPPIMILSDGTVF